MTIHKHTPEVARWPTSNITIHKHTPEVACWPTSNKSIYILRKYLTIES